MIGALTINGFARSARGILLHLIYEYLVAHL